MITVKKITTDEELKIAFAIRQRVFVEEQEVDAREEYDEFESSSTHFLAFLSDKPVGTARWRFYGEKIKLERFAVLIDARGKNVGTHLVNAVKNDLPQSENEVFLHAQLKAMPLYAKTGFEKNGPQFEEAGIQHFKMTLNR
ncbi:MAG: putative GNAT family N-acyltransferase [Sphingobacteriales bacterium]